MPYYILYATREVLERCIIKAKNEDDAVEKSDNEKWQMIDDLSWEITSIHKENK